MKGPRGRRKFDVRRVWECPVCHRRARTSGQVVNRECACLATSNPPRQVWMKLIEDEAKKPTADPQPEGQPPGGPAPV
jgi:hypothetical protein